MKRIAVFGNAGGGKSTLARELAAITGLPLVVVDKLQYRAGGAKVPDEEYLQAHAALLASDEWIMDGFGGLKLLWERLEAADTLVHVDLPLAVHAFWVTKRLIKGLFVPPQGWPEDAPVVSSSISSYRVLWPCHARLTPRYRSYVSESAKRKRVFHLRSSREQMLFLESMRTEHARVRREAAQPTVAADARAVANVRHCFESPRSTQTLAEGLAEYFQANPSLKRDDELLSPEAKQFFRSHDAVHVLYGCGTTMPDEAVVKLSSLLGTTGGLAVLRGYTNYETLDIYTKLPFGGTVLAFLCAPYLILRTLWRCSRQTRRWPWVEHQQFMDVPLNELRSQFGIKVAHARSAA